MVYFDDQEIMTLKKMIDECYDCNGDYEIPLEYTELIGVLNFKIECGKLKDELYLRNSKDGAAE